MAAVLVEEGVQVQVLSSPGGSGFLQPSRVAGHPNLGNSHLAWLMHFTSSFFSAPLVQ